MKLKKILAVALLAVSAMGFQIANAQSLSPSTKWHWDKGTIVIDTPERPAGQEHVLGLTAAPVKTVRIGGVGYAWPVGSDPLLPNSRGENRCAL